MRAAFEGGSLDGSDLQDMGVEHGLLELVEYDPETHGEEAQNEYGSEKGDPYYVYTNILK